MRRRIRVYLASPLFNAREREFNIILRDRLSVYVDVYLPQADGLLLFDLISNGMPVPEAERMIFDADIAAMEECLAVLAVLDGATVDEGVAFELGYMYAKGKLCLAFQTDVRRQLPTGNNPMIKRAISKTFTSIEEAEVWARATEVSSRSVIR